MGKVATGSEARTLVPARSYYAIINGIYDIGLQMPSSAEYRPNSQFVIQYELHTRKGPARDEKGDPMEICAFVNFYLGNITAPNPSKLLLFAQAVERRKFSDQDIKRGWDIESALGKAVKIQVEHNKAGKAVVNAVTKLDDDDDEPSAQLDQHYFEIKNGDTTIPDYVPKFIHEYIKKSKEFGGWTTPAAVQGQGQQTRQPVGAASSRPTPPPPPGVDADSVDDDDIPF